MNVEAPGGAPVAATELAARIFADRNAAFLRLAAGVAHELRNPLAVILARAQLLALEIAQGRRPEPVKIESVLKIIEEQAIRASGIIESLSMFARPRRPVLDALDMATVVQDALQTLRQRAEAAGVTVEVAIEQAPVTLSA
ncbi:MAG TPA: histidine kinase dimerization/phospho-acceptor domain-containing protein, partial [Methylomirabilota bacterium]|nr:histidine kinase dimerization/phospho-acceptor domain-containing protein [Methylomirabilota bacterium]